MSTRNAMIRGAALAAALLASGVALSADALQALTGKYCTPCHNTEDWAGGLDLSTLDHAHVGRNAETWEKVVVKLRSGMMPPPGKERPSRNEADAVLRTLETRLDAEASVRAAAPALHRLNRIEYANAIRDIFGLAIDAATLLPPDDSSNGFDNVAAGLGVSPALIQAYTTAAMKLSRTMVGDMTATESIAVYQVPTKLAQDQHLEGLPPGSRGGLRFTHYFPLDAEYRISVRNAGGFGGGGGGGGFGGFAGGGFAGGFNGGGAFDPRNFAQAAGAAAGAGGAGAAPGAAPGAVGFDFRNAAAAAGGFDVRNMGALNRGGASPIDVTLDGQRVEVPNLRNFTLRVKAGPHELTAALFDQRRTAGVNDIYSVYRVTGGIDAVEITGPFNATGPGDTQIRRRIFSCHPQAPAAERGCAERIVVDIASRAFRAPQKPQDLAVILEFYERGRAEGGFEAGIQQALARILVDPRFLFRIEEEPPATTAGTLREISDLELASRLSFFLWSSIPDQPLIDLAVQRKLHQPQVLVAQVKRMLADERARALVENFAGQWLFLRELATVAPEVEGFDENLRQAFIEETQSLVGWVIAQDRPLTELLTANYTFLNERLARHYGIAGVRGAHFRRVQLPPGSHRRGLLGHGSILTITSTATRTSPVIRGAWVLENILGAPPPAPPPGVETNIDGDGTQVLTSSVRARLEAHRKNPSCGACHGVIDPVGFALENFSAIGAWRERDGDNAVDARGTLVDGTTLAGPDDLINALMARPQMFVTTFTEKLLTYALGRTVDYRDMPTVRAIVQQAGREDYKVSALIMGVVQSATFRQRATAKGGT